MASFISKKKITRTRVNKKEEYLVILVLFFIKKNMPYYSTNKDRWQEQPWCNAPGNEQNQYNPNPTT